MTGRVHFHLYAWRVTPGGVSLGNEQATRYETSVYPVLAMAVQVHKTAMTTTPPGEVRVSPDNSNPCVQVVCPDGTIWNYVVGRCSQAKNGTGKDYMCPAERYALRNARQVAEGTAEVQQG